MNLPQMQDIGTTRKVWDAFYGYYHGKTVGEGYFYDEGNMSHRDYPLLSTRPGRKVVREFTNFQGMIVKDALCWVDDGDIYINDYQIEGLHLREGEKQMISMGAYLLIWPDCAYVNTQDFTDKGWMEQSFTGGDVACKVCNEEGEPYNIMAEGSTAPSEASDGDTWMDTQNHLLKVWDGDSRMWIEAASVYVRIESPGIDTGFDLYDGVTISGLENEDLNGSHVIMAMGENFIAITGILDHSFQQEGEVTVKREVPDMDFVTECDNRIWGCKYGLVNGRTVNEIYACALGRFKVWNRFMGMSTDSYTVSRGSDGVFTGAITWDGHPVFFKENTIEKVYPASNGAHQIVTQQARGVQRGCHKSLCIVGETLFYKSIMDVCAYGGGQPSAVSLPLGDVAYDNAVGGVIGQKYYLSMKANGVRTLFVYDTAQGTWHKEDGIEAQQMAFMDGALYIAADNQLYGYGGDEKVKWFVETGEIGFLHNRRVGEFHPDHKYLSRFQIRAAFHGKVRCLVKYDNDKRWTQKGTMEGYGKIEPYIVPVMPRRCDHMKLRLEGEGQATLYSLAYILEQGSEIL